MAMGTTGYGLTPGNPWEFQENELNHGFLNQRVMVIFLDTEFSGVNFPAVFWLIGDF